MLQEIFLLAFTVYFLYFSQLICMLFFSYPKLQGPIFLWWWIWHHNLTCLFFITKSQNTWCCKICMMMELDLQICYGVRFGCFCLGKRGVWWGLVLWVSGLLAIIVYNIILCFSLYPYFIINEYKLTPILILMLLESYFILVPKLKIIYC